MAHKKGDKGPRVNPNDSQEGEDGETKTMITISSQKEHPSLIPGCQMVAPREEGTRDAKDWLMSETCLACGDREI